MMPFLKGFYVLPLYMIQGLFFAWPITFLLIANLVVSYLISKKNFSNNNFRSTHYFLVPFLFSAILVTIGVLFQKFDGHAVMNFLTDVTWPTYLIYFLFVIHILISMQLCLKMRNFLWFVISVQFLSLWITFLASAVSFMSVNGSWI